MNLTPYRILYKTYLTSTLLTLCTHFMVPIFWFYMLCKLFFFRILRLFILRFIIILIYFIYFLSNLSHITIVWNGSSACWHERWCICKAPSSPAVWSLLSLIHLLSGQSVNLHNFIEKTSKQILSRGHLLCDWSWSEIRVK